MFDHQIALLQMNLDFLDASWLEVRFESFPERGGRIGSSR